MSLFEDLQRYTGAQPDRHGECHLPCPACKHESSPRNPHCSFSEHGYHCFVCGANYSLPGLAKVLGMGERDYSAEVRRPEPKPVKPASWMANPGGLLAKYESHPRRYELWQGYKPLQRSTIERRRLGVGVLPVSRCHHERLIVPIWDGSMLVGLRGRSLGCDCGKWLAPGGTVLNLLPLFNADSLRRGAVVWIVENPVDALMIG